MALTMSAFGGKADMTLRSANALMTQSGHATDKALAAEEAEWILIEAGRFVRGSVGIQTR
jgi:hypothetical protein